MHFSIITIFPSLIEANLTGGIVSKADKEGKINIEIINLRDFADDKHRTTDDRPYGGGEGMVMKPEPLARAVNHAKRRPVKRRRVILLSPQGRQFSQSVAEELSREKQLILVCGRYEGVDERFTSNYIDDEISIGDFILTGGELPALMIVDGVARLLPGVLGCSSSATNDTFCRNLLKHPQYTRPRVFEDVEVPEALLNGDHAEIAELRFVASVRRTIERRPDLMDDVTFSSFEKRLLKKYGIATSSSSIGKR